ncbi:hypothetical protein WP8S17C03_11420 [Metapseudomonas otitidis]|uniref:Uncharacterized protein n=1 Tax=Metapseudomonas otitidis TaxID=319939 RepID=A0A6S5RJA9_9GAMM|nr:hypothetical protein WP8S17C03_11420 [Pseudomonas otitidis]
MCGGVQIGKQYTDSGKVLRIYFPNPYARLPVRYAAGAEVRWIPWGRREGQGGVGPRGGWARDDSITAGKWARYRPIDCLVPVEAMMEKDADRVSHWFAGGGLETELRALLVGDGEEQRVYVVTGSPPERYAWVKDRWPVAMSVEWDEMEN